MTDLDKPQSLSLHIEIFGELESGAVVILILRVVRNLTPYDLNAEVVLSYL